MIYIIIDREFNNPLRESTHDLTNNNTKPNKDDFICIMNIYNTTVTLAFCLYDQQTANFKI